MNTGTNRIAHFYKAFALSAVLAPCIPDFGQALASAQQFAESSQPMLFWPFNEFSGTEVSDLAFNSTGLIQGRPTLGAPGPFPAGFTSILFDDPNSSVIAQSPQALTFSTQFELESEHQLTPASQGVTSDGP